MMLEVLLVVPSLDCSAIFVHHSENIKEWMKDVAHESDEAQQRKHIIDAIELLQSLLQSLNQVTSSR